MNDNKFTIFTITLDPKYELQGLSNRFRRVIFQTECRQFQAIHLNIKFNRIL